MNQTAKRLAWVAAILLAASVDLCAQSYPEKPIRMLLPFPTGATFLVGHLVAEGLSEALKSPVVAENRTGAGGSVAMEAVAKSAPDGYTLLVVTPSLTITPIIRSNLRFDPLRDLVPVSLVARVPNVLVVHAAVPAKTIKELVSLARARPGQLTFGTSGMGSSQHLASELFSMLAKIRLQHVPYQSGTHALTALVGGDVDLVIGGLPTAAPLIVTGRLRGLAVLTRSRSATLPDVPTVVEQAMPELVVDTWYGVVAPRGTKEEIIALLNREITRIFKAPEMQKRMARIDLEPFNSTVPEFAEFIRADSEKWTRVIRESKLKFEQ